MTRSRRSALPSAAPVEVRSEEPRDVAAVEAVVADAFRLAEHSAPPTSPGGPPGEVDLLRLLREDEGWLPALSLVAESAGEVVGHVVCTRAHVDSSAALGLGPLAVRPDHQGAGVGAALVREVLLRAEAAGESLVALVGEPAYYGRFGFVPARELGIEPPQEQYGDYFQALRLGGAPVPQGRFRYADPFDRV